MREVASYVSDHRIRDPLLAHEVLGVYSGEVTAQFGGEDGIVVTARAGDVIVRLR